MRAWPIDTSLVLFILSKKNLFYGTIQMPKGFEIKSEIIQKDILTHNIQDLSLIHI